MVLLIFWIDLSLCGIPADQKNWPPSLPASHGIQMRGILYSVRACSGRLSAPNNHWIYNLTIRGMYFSAVYYFIGRPCSRHKKLDLLIAGGRVAPGLVG